MSITAIPRSTVIVTGGDVYAPQDDSHLLIEQVAALPAGLSGLRVLDFCTGSGVVALAAARLGSASVTAVDVSAQAAGCARRNAAATGLTVEVITGSFAEAAAAGPYDVVLCNPPYVPAPISAERFPVAGPTQAWDASTDGRLVLDPLCSSAPELLTENGTLLLVQSEYSGIDETLDALDRAGMDAQITARRTVDFGPVMASRALWMEDQGMLVAGCREEVLVVVRARKR